MILNRYHAASSEIEFLSLVREGNRYYVELHDDIANGFPSPADDFQGRKISLDERYISKPESTFIGRAKGLSNAPYILPGDFMIIRTDLEPGTNELGIFYIPGDGFTAKLLDYEHQCLRPLNPSFPILDLTEIGHTECRGVVKAIFREMGNLLTLDFADLMTDGNFVS